MTDANRISVIIPCLNEEANLVELIPYLQQNGGVMIREIIVVDEGSKGSSITVAELLGALVVHSPTCSRAAQLNLGAKHAKGDIFYFVHADTRPVENYPDAILESIFLGKEVGCFYYRFDRESRLLKLNSWFTQFNGLLSGGGDQSLFIKKSLFEALGGYDETFCIMEDFEMVSRIRQKSNFHVISNEMTVSASKYSENSWLIVHLANLTAFSLFLLKVKPATIKSLYLNFLNHKNKKYNSS
ncbi:TIGR04283 family arsenosugar biosynthesis glycosyltransferase [Algoriphagus persicinus]|uniref:TIGR04283 family arsenosugar biosynthesis glycosyltransferase n=1 Tax=Algoriphagus persicinus TaxID=3108754 RepID=UPI002B398AD6|nr:TIGR04283 family arsenosugar biosynthesis glycosyltransferase [Algoriphagus sp. E1-3-M2]MEB2784170.1 TIGR04283 family arsenosugar biosynthesis glycosyltransferase [Algoriphagus sp. E1-3-M2]